MVSHLTFTRWLKLHYDAQEPLLQADPKVCGWNNCCGNFLKTSSGMQCQQEGEAGCAVACLVQGSELR